jgi:hypothetical protein
METRGAVKMFNNDAIGEKTRNDILVSLDFIA